MQKENGSNKCQRENEDDIWVTNIGNKISSSECYAALKCDTYTRSPGESSVYSFSIVPDEPPAPAARVEFGFICVFAALRL